MMPFSLGAVMKMRIPPSSQHQHEEKVDRAQVEVKVIERLCNDTQQGGNGVVGVRMRAPGGVSGARGSLSGLGVAGAPSVRPCVDELVDRCIAPDGRGVGRVGACVDMCEGHT